MTPESRDSPADEPSEPARERPHSTAGTDVDRWKRVVSVALGGTLLTVGLRRRSFGGSVTALAGGALLYRGVGGREGLSRALGANGTADRERQEGGASADATEVEATITVGKPADELYGFWRDPESLARIVGHFAEVTAESEDRQRWTVRGPLGRSVEWNTRVAEDDPDELLRWESFDGARVPTEWTVRFRPAPGDRGTEVTLRWQFDPPGGALGDAAVKLLGVAPSLVVDKALRRFKSLAETGEIPTLERNPSARGSGDVL